ncbi:hypothetical protein O3M35_005082 [Rhynocoris fuscipes]|uniref:Transmembrane protein 267 n=1 Tax=Rhynocoris fuscipes TaxID=488301 RepID=A0AAW1DGZ0_9HEMI
MGDESKLKVLLSQGLLAASGFQGLYVAQNKKLHFGVPAYSTSLLAGCIGFLEKLMGNETITKVNRYTSPLAHTLVLPLIAAEVCYRYGVQWIYAAAHLAYPIIHYLCRNTLQNLIKTEYLEISHAISTAIVAYFSYCESNEWAAIMSIIYAIASLVGHLIDDLQIRTLALALANLIHATMVA